MSPLGSKSAKKEAAPKPGKADKAAAKAAAKAEKAAAKAAAKASKGAKTPAAPPSATRGIVVEKARPDIYTVMLAIALVALLIGCLMLYLEMSIYDMSIKARL